MIKQVIVWRKDLQVRLGKKMAQCAHASMKVFFDRMQLYDFIDLDNNKNNVGANCKFTFNMVKWMQGSFTKIVVGCNSEQELFDLQKQAEEAGIVNAIIQDLGNTEFKEICFNCNGTGNCRAVNDQLIKCLTCNGTGKINKPTYTCLAIGPDEAEKIDKITGSLKLL